MNANSILRVVMLVLTIVQTLLFVVGAGSAIFASFQAFPAWFALLNSIWNVCPYPIILKFRARYPATLYYSIVWVAVLWRVADANVYMLRCATWVCEPTDPQDALGFLVLPIVQFIFAAMIFVPAHFLHKWLKRWIDGNARMV